MHPLSGPTLSTPVCCLRFSAALYAAQKQVEASCDHRHPGRPRFPPPRPGSFRVHHVESSRVVRQQDYAPGHAPRCVLEQSPIGARTDSSRHRRHLSRSAAVDAQSPLAPSELAVLRSQFNAEVRLDLLRRHSSPCPSSRAWPGCGQHAERDEGDSSLTSLDSLAVGQGVGFGPVQVQPQLGSRQVERPRRGRRGRRPPHGYVSCRRSVAAGLG